MTKWPFRIFLFTHFADAFLADILSAVQDQIPEGSAEHTGRLKFLQNNMVIFHVDLQLIPLRDVQRPAELNGQHDAAQLIHLANDAS